MYCWFRAAVPGMDVVVIASVWFSTAITRPPRRTYSLELDWAYIEAVTAMDSTNAVSRAAPGAVACGLGMCLFSLTLSTSLLAGSFNESSASFGTTRA